MRFFASLCLFFASYMGSLQAQAASPSSVLFERGVKAYRAAEFGEAEAHWLGCFAEDLSDEDSGRVAYNLGNSAHRQGHELDAVGWYTSALRYLPRDPELWENLEIARAAAGLEAADGGDLKATYRRLMRSFLPSEARGLLAFGLGLLLLACLGEALRGGRFWTRSIWVCLVLCAFLSIPWFSMRKELGGNPVLIVAKPSVALRSEPRQGLPSTGKLDAGLELQRIDALPGWVRVEEADGRRGWVPETAIFELKR